MTFEEAMKSVSDGSRVAADTFAAGCYVEQTPLGIMKAWPVERPEDEWQRSQCRFVAHEIDQQSSWAIVSVSPLNSQGKPLTRPVAIPEGEGGEVKTRRSKWGQTSEEAQLIAIEQKRLRDE